MSSKLLRRWQCDCIGCAEYELTRANERPETIVLVTIEGMEWHLCPLHTEQRLDRLIETVKAYQAQATMERATAEYPAEVK